MPIFKSKQPDINLPTDITVWDWLFDSPQSPLSKYPESQIAGYLNAETKERVSYRQVKEYSTYVSTALVKKYGLQEDDTVALFSQNTIWYPVAMFAILRAGGKVSGASPAYNVEEMSYALKIGQAKFLMTASSSIEVAKAAAQEAGIPQEHIFLLEGNINGYTTIKELIEIGKSYGEKGQIKAFKLPPERKNKDVCGFLSFSSGTTGLPKAVMITHQNVIAQCLQVQQITPEDHKKILAVLPLFHITGLVHGLNLPILLNAEVIMCPTFTMPSMLSTIATHKITELLLVPPILIRLVHDPEVAKHDLSHVRRFSSGAAPLSEEILQLLQKRFPGTGFKQGYGMTESCSCITAHTPEYYDFKYAHTVGTIVASTEVKIIREDGTECGIGEPGEIPARGPQIVMGYLDNEKATKETFYEGGWLHTGDQGWIDKEGLITISDRIKELIKVKGIGVAPAELEDLLLGHEMVEDVAVVGVRDDYAGELSKAFVVVKKGTEGSEKIGRELMRFVKEKKVRHKWIKEVEFVDEIPKSASGKILRRVLRDNKGGKSVVVREAVGEKAML
ncbi:4-coumarate-CoA ligase 2 [Aulographum hederae CBS 113979]|uniref:4-coumarate-CoA ligase 2 n=1 Tax=Aulographum hederae CBS 113979 TaxID=1176131 RepID=A0A6G1GXS6_9PEZI|nr:4-coumarate-CoA ligase 2 [Aulographum hederae CBS 113979]